LSLTAGLSPALTSFPGTVYLRGDNGTKVLNGLYIDHLYPAAGYTLAISGASGSNVTIDDCAYLGMTSNPVIDGGNVNGQIRNFSTISALKFLAPTLNVSTISTGTVFVDQIYTRNINIDPPSTVYISHPDLTINANITTDEAEDPQYNNLNLYASSNINIQSFTTSGGGGNINIQCGNNPSVFSVNITGDTYVSRTLTANLGMSTTNINLSTINGAAYTPGGGGGGWVSTATSALNMNGYVITDTTSTVTVSSINVNIGGAEFLGLAAGNVLANYTSIALFSTSVFIAQVGDTSGVIDINAAGNIQTSAFSTINTVQNTYFSGGVSRRLAGVGVEQPVIQYGQVSSSGASGTVIVSTPYAYSAVNTYLPFACKADGPEAEMYVSTLTEQAFEIGWSSGGSGAHTFNWNTLGT
jgi:hypothetical protein